MVFSSNLFLYAFLPVVLVAYYLAPRVARNSVLLAASLFFYAWGEKQYVWVLLASIAANWAAGLWLSHSKSKWLLALVVAGNLLLLVAFKYANFLADQANLFLPALGLSEIHLRPVHLPIGISFFTFQAIAYVVDVYRADVPVERSGTRYAVYAAMFPHLVAGPIVRYRDISHQLGDRRVTIEDVATGARRFIIGLAKKALLANTLGATADAVFARPADELSAGLAWLGLVCYSLQIYFDFSGYSDMAIGLGKLFGFDFLENFRHPYAAASVTDFWRRWHISLSSWLRDYVYIPLGGNRGGPKRTVLNLLIVFALCGLWHGAAWSFLVWGLWHGVFLILERVGLRVESWPRPLRHMYVLLAVMGGWVFFRADTLGHALSYLVALSGAGDSLALASDYLNREIALALVIGAVASVPFGPWLLDRLRAGQRGLVWREAGLAAAQVAACAVLLHLAMLWLASGTYNPFLYFRF